MNFETLQGIALGASPRLLHSMTLKATSNTQVQQWTPGLSVTVVGISVHGTTTPGGWLLSKTGMTVATFLALGAGSLTPDLIFNGVNAAGTTVMAPLGFEVAAAETVYFNFGSGAANSVAATIFYLS